MSSKSKEILYKNGIIISTPTSQQFISSQNLNNSRKTVAQEVFKLFLKQIKYLNIKNKKITKLTDGKTYVTEATLCLVAMKLFIAAQER